LDKHVKTKVIDESIRLVTGEGSGEYEGSFEQLLPVEDGSMEKFYLWNKAQNLFDLVLQTSSSKKDPEKLGRITQFQFLRLAKITEFSKAEGTYFKADLEMLFKSLIKQHDSVSSIDIYDFFTAIEKLSAKLFKDEEEMSPADKIEQFVETATPFFEEFLLQQQEEKENF